MKKTVVMILAALFLMASGTVFAAERPTSMDVFGGIGTEPADELGVGFGVGVGLNIPFDSVFNAGVEDLMIRTDLGYSFWDEEITAFGITSDLEFTRIPWFLGVRYFLPADIFKTQTLGIFLEGGLELSFDKAEVCLPAPIGCASDDEVNFGVPLGFGLQYNVSDSVYLGLNGRLHLISDSYFGLVGAIGFAL